MIKMRFGVVGLGNWGQKVAREYIALLKEGRVESLLLCDSDAARLRQFAGTADTCRSVGEMAGKVDAVHVCTPNSSHYDVASGFLKSGVNVLVEKPMAETVSDASKLLETSLSQNRILQVGHIFRFSNMVRSAMKLYSEGTLGDVSSFNLAWTHMMEPVKNNDVIYDLLPHPVDILNSITGEWPTGFVGTGRSVRHGSSIDFCYLQCMYPKGKMANIYLSWVSAVRRRTLEIVGSKGTLIGDCVKQEATLYTEGGESKLEIVPNNTIREEILNFMSAAERGENRHNSGVVGLQSVEAIIKAHDAVKGGG